MKFQSKFEVGDFLVNKVNTFNDLEAIINNSDGLVAHKVQEIIVQRCYSATQIFYLTSPVHILTKGERRFGGEDYVMVVNAMLNKNTAGLHGAWQKQREDEMDKIDVKKTVSELKKALVLRNKKKK